ncbi:MAG TPA: hypothetical protein VFV99_13785 [Kofleriaceae bacterium]|nr:hypothetical protein [Kofleriaceae bacterium]
MKIATLAGIVIVAAHAAGFAWLAQKSGGSELMLTVPELAVRATGETPGLHRSYVRTEYRGGHVREIGTTELVGPFQDPKAPACSGRVVVGQKLLDAMAPVMKDMVTEQMRGTDIFPVGSFQRVRSLSLEWARAESNPGDRRLLGSAGAPDGYVRANATVVFDRGEVALLVAFIPQRSPTSLKFRIAAVADLEFNNSVLRWVSDKLGADRIATSVAREQIDDILVTTFAPPPPFELPGGQSLQFIYCDGPIEIVDGAYGALPFAVAFTPLPNAPQILPPRFGPGARPAPPPDTTLALDLDVDALNAMLFELWRTGWLDRELANVGLDRRFNTDPIVTDYLSIRISPVRLALPPVIAPHAGALRLAADARVAIADGAHTTVGRAFGALDFHFVKPATTDLPVSVDLGALELACERTPTTLVPCYSDLVGAIRDRGAELHGALTDAFAALLGDIFIDRHLGTTGLPAELVIGAVVPSVTRGGTLHLQLAGTLVPVQ